MGQQNIRLFVDMDGTLAQFRRVSELEELYRPGYFLNQKPQKSVVDAIRLLYESSRQVEVFILSAVLADSKTALAEKNTWLDRYLQQIDAGHRIFLPCGNEKAAYVPDGVGPDDFLLDDYTENLNDWVRSGGHGIKLLNDINHTRGSWTQSRLRYDRGAAQITYNLMSILLSGETVLEEKPQPDLEKYTAAMEQLGYEPAALKGLDDDFLLWKERSTSRLVGLDGLQGIKDFLKEKGRHINADYEIIQTVETVSNKYVLGQDTKYPDRYVTWLGPNGKEDYFWGHYFKDKLEAQKDLLHRALENIELEISIHQKQKDEQCETAAAPITEHSEDISVEGHEGTWYAIEKERINSADYFLLEHKRYGDEAAALIVNSQGKLVLDDVRNGFDDLVEYLPDSLSSAEKEAFIQDMNKQEAVTVHEREIYDALIDWQAACSIDAHEAEYGADGWRAFGGNPLGQADITAALHSMSPAAPELPDCEPEP